MKRPTLKHEKFGMHDFVTNLDRANAQVFATYFCYFKQLDDESQRQLAGNMETIVSAYAPDSEKKLALDELTEALTVFFPRYD